MCCSARRLVGGGALIDELSQILRRQIDRRPLVRAAGHELVFGIAGAEHHRDAAGRHRDRSAQRRIPNVNIDVLAGFGIAHGQRNVAAHGRAALVRPHRLGRLALAVDVRLEAERAQLVGYGVQVVARFLEEGVLRVVAGLARPVAVAVNGLHAPILRKHHVALLARLARALLGLLGDLAHGVGLQVFRSQQRLELPARLFRAGHVLGVQAGVVARTFPERQQVGPHAVAHVLDHGLGVLREVANAGLDVGASNGHAVDQQLGVDTAVERSQLGLHAGAGGGHLVGGEQLVVGEAVGDRGLGLLWRHRICCGHVRSCGRRLGCGGLGLLLLGSLGATHNKPAAARRYLACRHNLVRLLEAAAAQLALCGTFGCKRPAVLRRDDVEQRIARHLLRALSPLLAGRVQVVAVNPCRPALTLFRERGHALAGAREVGSSHGDGLAVAVLERGEFGGVGLGGYCADSGPFSCRRAFLSARLLRLRSHLFSRGHIGGLDSLRCSGLSNGSCCIGGAFYAGRLLNAGRSHRYTRLAASCRCSGRSIHSSGADRATWCHSCASCGDST